MTVLGIDPGLAITGYAVIEEASNGFLLRESGLIRTKSTQELPARLREIFLKLTDLGKTFGVSEMACEKLFFEKNVKTGIAVAQARGVILLCAALSEIPVFEYPPSTVKLALTGYGAADKQQMQKMVRLLLNLKSAPKVDDEADAMGVAICHLQSRRIMQCSGT
ncbi:MAG: crossover junction endodeoxyribonuclease RuvC [Candidatus Wallbacteria bacterium]|nr:crossover junction endodeoxyribonuclease RuvC [Candidatus Wallbacteria bacterium]